MKLVLTTLLCCLCAGCATPAVLAPAAEGAIVAAVKDCLNFMPTVTDPERTPPGLNTGTDVKAVSLPGTNGRAFRYRSAITCGVAVYGAVPISLRANIQHAIEEVVQLRRPGQAPRQTEGETAWGGPETITLRERAPENLAPTIDMMFVRVPVVF